MADLHHFLQDKAVTKANGNGFDGSSCAGLNICYTFLFALSAPGEDSDICEVNSFGFERSYLLAFMGTQ